MSKEDKYFTFPLSVLSGLDRNPTPLDCLELASDCGAVNAGIGFLNLNDPETFEEKLEQACDHYSLEEPDSRSWGGHEQHYVVGAKICGLQFAYDYDTKNAAYRARRISDHNLFPTDKRPFIRMSSESLWAAIYQARYDDDPTKEKPKHGLSWREFRVLAAILSWPETREGFTSPSVQSIQFRSCGFVNSEEFDKAKRIPDHLPKLSSKQITATLDTLEALNMFARFRLSTGGRGGKMFYSFRHSREELAEAVCKKVNFQDRQRVTQNRADDLAKSLVLLERAKSGKRSDKALGKAGESGGQSRGESGGQSWGQT
jgi:hypothetical protein